jgi:uncharacterized protein (TIGR03435 family)
MRTFAKLAVLAVLATPIFAQAPPPPSSPPLQTRAQPKSSAGASSPSPAAIPSTKFEAADVGFTPPYRVPFYSGAFLTSDRYIIHQGTMVHLVMTAWGLKSGGFVGGGPSWVAWDRYDIMAKVPPGTTLETARLMLQNLLAERFKLVVHPGDVPVPAFLLSVADRKSILKPSTATEEGSCKFRFEPGTVPSFGLSCKAVTMDSLANTLNGIESRDYVPYGVPVINATGLKGLYDLELKWTPKWTLPQAGSSGVSIFQTLGQYGLNFEFKTAPQPGIVIDSVNEAPTPNAADLAKIMPPLPPPQFEVATIRISAPDEKRGGTGTGDEIDYRGFPLRFFIGMAWDLDPGRDDLLIAPKWLDSERIDVHAKVAASDLGSSSMGGRSNSMNWDNFRPMLRSLLIDRFQIKYHMEDRPIDAYTLEVSDPKLASLKLVKAAPSERTACGSALKSNEKDPSLTNIMLDSNQSCWNTTMDQFAGQLHRIASDYFFFPVKDETGLKGAWDFTFYWSSAHLTQGPGPGPGASPTPAAAPDAAPAASDPNGAISVFDAIRKQLGLKIVKEKRPEPVLVIDQISEQPTEN